MKAIAIIAMLGAITLTYLVAVYPNAEDSEMIGRYHKYLAEYGKSYNSENEFEFRFQIFKENANLIDAHNAQESTYTLGINKFADWTEEEYKRLLGYNHYPFNCEDTVCKSPTKKEVNWVKAGAVNAVQNQGSCGSCWAFTTVGAIEGAHFKTTGELLKFSEQQFVDCCKDQCEGCHGGLQNIALQWAEEHDLCLESQYKYKGRQGQCKESQCEHTFHTVNKCHTICPYDVNALKAAIEIEPVSMSVDSHSVAFKFYYGGIFNSASCGKRLDHAVLGVGYGEDYILIKNSWGLDWGDMGYMKISAKNTSRYPKEGICGMLMDNSYADSD